MNNTTLLEASKQLGMTVAQLRASFGSEQALEAALALPAAGPSPLAPPYNMGAKNTGLRLQSEKRALVDYLRFSVTKPGAMFGTVDAWRDWLSDGDLECWRAGNGGMSYRESWHYGDITIYHDGRQEGMGYCVQLSGQGCRELEANPRFKTWEALLYGLLGMGGATAVNFTRLDVALDDKEGALDIAEIERKARADEYTCRSGVYVDSSPSVRGSKRRGGVKEWGQTVYFGRRTASQLCRIYNKAVEDANKNGTEIGDHWIRVEFEAHDKRAAALAEQIVIDGVGSVCGAILNHVDFKEPSADSNKARQETCSWWTAFLASWDKISLVVAPVERTILKLRTWLENQVSASLATAYESFTGRQRKAFLADLVLMGQKRMKKRHKDLLQRDTGERAMEVHRALTGAPCGF